MHFLVDEVVAHGDLHLLHLGSGLVDSGSEVGGVASEGDVHHFEEFVHTGNQTLGGTCVGLFCRYTVEYDNLVGQVGSHNEIVLYNEGATLGGDDPAFHYSRSTDSLLGVQVSGGLIDQQNVAWLGEAKHDGHSLQLTTRQSLYFVVKKRFHIERIHDLSFEKRCLPGNLELGVEQITY